MSRLTIILITLLISTLQAARPTTKLTFIPNEKYMPYKQQVEIRCELINPNQRSDTAQLWHVDLKTKVRTSISRSLLTAPTDDAPDVFRTNRNRRYEYVHKNQIRIRNLGMEDSARYECNCPDCEESVGKQTQDLKVMQLREPEWKIEPGWPLHENTKAVIKCQASDFYPHVSHRILRDNLEITNTGKSNLSSEVEFPQTFVWESTITPTPEWHNSTLRCSITEGSTQQESIKTLDVLFAARFLKCEERQFVDAKKEQSTIECAYSGNPRPQLHWFRQSDQKSITSDYGVVPSTKEDGNGKYRSIITFERSRLQAIPLTTSAAGQENPSGETYYQQLLNKGFLVKLTVNGNEKATRIINIVRDANQIRSNSLNHSTRISSSATLLLFLFLLRTRLIQR